MCRRNCKEPSEHDAAGPSPCSPARRRHSGSQAAAADTSCHTSGACYRTSTSGSKAPHARASVQPAGRRWAGSPARAVPAVRAASGHPRYGCSCTDLVLVSSELASEPAHGASPICSKVPHTRTSAETAGRGGQDPLLALCLPYVQHLDTPGMAVHAQILCWSAVSWPQSQPMAQAPSAARSLTPGHQPRQLAGVGRIPCSRCACRTCSIWTPQVWLFMHRSCAGQQ